MKMLTMLWLALLLIVAQPVNVEARDIIDTRGFDVAWEVLSQPRYREVTMNISAYTAHEGGSIGAWGKELTLGDCASDDLPQGTKVIIDGKKYTVNDKFGGGYKDRLDIYYGWDLDAALNFGRRELTVKVEIQ